MTHDFMMRNVYKPKKELDWEQRNHPTSHYRYRFHHSNTRPATHKDTYYHEDILTKEQWKEKVKPKKSTLIYPGTNPKNGASQSELTKTEDNVIPFFFESGNQKRKRVVRESIMSKEDNPFDVDEENILKDAKHNTGTMAGMEKWIASKLEVCLKSDSSWNNICSVIF